MIQRVSTEFTLLGLCLLLLKLLCSNRMHGFALQALHLIGQALLEEKSQLEDSTVEEVTFDFSLKARSE